MTSLQLISSSSSAVAWAQPLMIGWLVIALGLSVIELFWRQGRFQPIWTESIETEPPSKPSTGKLICSPCLS
jgi:hypothetical protein